MMSLAVALVLAAACIKTTPLMQAAMDGDRNAMRSLLDSGVNVNEKNERGDTALLWAVNRQSIDLATLLLERGADPNVQESHGVTPLMLAANMGQMPMVSLLLDHKANPNLQNQANETALGFAAARGDLEMVQLLRHRGANPQLRNVNGQTPAMVAETMGHPDVARLLLPADITDKLEHSSREASNAGKSGAGGSASQDSVPSGRLQGLYYYEYNTSKHETDYYLFTVDGRVFNGLPAGGVRSFAQVNLTALCQRFPQQCGNYSIQGQQISFRWSGGRPGYTHPLQLRSNAETNDVAVINDKEYHKVRTLNGNTLNGAYYWTSKSNPGTVTNSGSPLPGGPIVGGIGDNITVSSSQHFLVFSSSGQFQEIHSRDFGTFSGSMGALTDGGRRVVGQGSYTVQDHMLELKYQTGQRKTYTFFIAPQFAKNLYLDGDDLPRCVKQDRDASPLERQYSLC
jgi:hypothetical protein